MGEKLVIVSDIDETLIDTLNWINNYYNFVSGRNLKIEDYNNYNLSEVWGISKEESQKILHKFHESDFFKKIKPFQEAQEVIKRLSVKSYLIAATCRKSSMHDRTKEFINFHFPEFNKIISNGREEGGTHSKIEVCIKEKADYLIDDNSQVVLECANAGIICFLIDRPWNKDCQGENIIRVKNLKEVEKYLENKKIKNLNDSRINENLKRMLYEKLVLIDDLEIRNFTKEVLDNAPISFWTRECSSTGKYHPPENQGNGGTIRHVLKCIPMAKDFCHYMKLNNQDKDIVISSIILHDIKKYNNDTDKYSSVEHGKLGYEFLKKFNLRVPEKTEIMNCVRYHLGPFTGVKEDVERGYHLNKKELIVYLVDIVCSRKHASWLPNLEIDNQKIKQFSKEGQTTLKF